MNLNEFIDQIQSDYDDAVNRGFDSIVITIDTLQQNTYYINDTEYGFQCDLFDYVTDDLYAMAMTVWTLINHEKVAEIRIE